MGDERLNRRGFLAESAAKSAAIAAAVWSAIVTACGGNSTFPTATPSRRVDEEDLRAVELTLLDGESGLLVPRGLVSVAASGREYNLAGGKGNVLTANGVDLEIRADGYLFRQTRFMGSRNSTIMNVTMWRDGCAGLLEKLLYQEQFSRRPAFPVTMAINLIGDAKDAVVKERYEDAAHQSEAILAGKLRVNVGSGIGGLVVNVSVNGSDKELLQNSRWRARTKPAVNNRRVITGAETVYLDIDAARVEWIVFHEHNHTLGLYHAPEEDPIPRLMHEFRGSRVTGGLTPEEVSALKLLWEAPPGTAWLYDDRFVVGR